MPLRQKLERQHGGKLFSLEQAVAQLLPLCAELERLHAGGRRCLVHGTNVVTALEGLRLRPGRESLRPEHPNDRACLAPELEAGALGEAHSSVFAIGALLYEMVTGRTVGHDMKRPRELFPTLPQALENLLSATLVTDPRHRLGDLAGLAAALRSLAPNGAVANESLPRLPRAHEAAVAEPAPLDLNLSLSLLPPVQPLTAHTRVNAYGVALQDQASPEPTSEAQSGSLAELKGELEKDKRPRYFITHEGMDHGPFTALELAHHIAAGNFSQECVVFDTVEGRRATVADWPPFSKFAEHARQRGERKAEAHAVAKDIQQEASSRRKLSYAFGAVVAALVVVAGVWYQSRAARQEREIALQAEKATSIETDAATVRRSRRRGGRARKASGQSASSGGTSCEEALANYVEDIELGKRSGPDLTQGQLAAVVGKGQYLSRCGVPANMKVEVCAAVQNGRAVGVTVRTTPASPAARRCITRAVRRLRFPRHPKMDKVRTVFE